MTSAQLILVAVTSAFVAVFVMLVVATVARARGRDDVLPADEPTVATQVTTPHTTDLPPQEPDEANMKDWKWAASDDETASISSPRAGSEKGSGTDDGSGTKKPAAKKTTATRKKTTPRKKPSTAGGGTKKTSSAATKRTAKPRGKTAPDE